MNEATIRTPVTSPALVAKAITPDNTDEMQTQVTDDTVVTTINRDDPGGLRATATDYIANVTVACEVVQCVDQHTTTKP